MGLNRAAGSGHRKGKSRELEMNNLERLEHEVSSWPHVSIHPHRFGGRDFRYGTAEIGHMHTGGVVDIPFPRLVRDALVEGGLAEEHHWVPNSGWITFQVRREEDVKHAVCLMRLSYLRYQLKRVSNPSGLLEQESEERHLSPHFRSVIAQLLPASTDRALPQTSTN